METRTEQAAGLLKDWVASVAPGIPVALLSATAPAEEGRIELRMVRLTPQPLPSDGRGTRKIWADYLLSARLGDALEEQRVLAGLMFAALDPTGFDLHPDDTAVLQRGLGLPATPGLVLRLPLVREGRARKVPLVRFPLEVEAADMHVYAGRLSANGVAKGVATDAATGAGAPAVVQLPVEN